MKRLLVLLFLLAGMVSVFCQEEVLVLDDALRNSVTYLADRLPKGAIVVVRDFTTDSDRLTDYIVDRLTEYMDSVGGFTVVERKNLEAIEEELDIHQSGEVSEATAQEIGQKLGAQIVIDGSLDFIGKEYQLSIKPIEVATAAVRAPHSERVSFNRLLADLLGIPLPLKGITVSSLPKKTVYKRREAFESSGIVVTGTYIDDSTEVVSGYTLNPAEGDKQITAGSGKKTITVTYNDQSTTFTITVNAGEAWSSKWLYFGARAGISPRFYKLSDDISGEVESPGISFEAGAHFALQIIRPLAVQIEVLYTADKVKYSGDGYEASFESHSLMFPALLKLTFRPGNFLIAAFGGAYFTLPLGELKTTSTGDEAGSFDVSIPIGLIGGLNFGLKLGPGVLFLDARYARELGNTSIDDGKGHLAIYSRGMMSFTLGYEIGIITRK
ncbi:MAG: bacterial Ig-like domain-containing protein [Treponema sp.]|nr:bacterial Ig-like domain-containing protein [Treponema sp.]